MKVIDLKKRTIYVDDVEQIYCDNFYNIQTIYGTYQVDREDYFKVRDYLLSLNDEVEIIEEDKKIEHLDIYNCFKVMGIDKTGRLDENFTDISNKINEIIDYINKENK